MRWMQLALSLNDWPTPDPRGWYELDLAHRVSYPTDEGIQPSVRVDVFVLQIYEATYIQAYTVRVAGTLHDRPLTARTRAKFNSPEQALHAALTDVRRQLLRHRHKQAQCYPVKMLEAALQWVDDRLLYCQYCVERQQRLFEE